MYLEIERMRHKKELKEGKRQTEGGRKDEMVKKKRRGITLNIGLLKHDSIDGSAGRCFLLQLPVH
jgi:hypothetical protein